MTAYTNYCIGRGPWPGKPIRRDKLSIYAFSLLRRPDHSARARARAHVCALALRELPMHTHRRRMHCAMYEKERPRRVRCVTADMDASRIHRRNSRTFQSRGCSCLVRLHYGEALRSRMNSGSFCKLIATNDHNETVLDVACMLNAYYLAHNLYRQTTKA